MSSFPENIKVYGLQSRSSATTAGLRSTALFKSWVQRSTPILNFKSNNKTKKFYKKATLCHTFENRKTLDANKDCRDSFISCPK